MHYSCGEGVTWHSWQTAFLLMKGGEWQECRYILLICPDKMSPGAHILVLNHNTWTSLDLLRHKAGLKAKFKASISQHFQPYSFGRGIKSIKVISAKHFSSWGCAVVLYRTCIYRVFFKILFCRVDSIMLVEEGFNMMSVDASDKMLKYALKSRWDRRKEPAFDQWGTALFILLRSNCCVWMFTTEHEFSHWFVPFSSGDIVTFSSLCFTLWPVLFSLTLSDRRGQLVVVTRGYSETRRWLWCRYLPRQLIRPLTGL